MHFSRPKGSAPILSWLVLVLLVLAPFPAAASNDRDQSQPLDRVKLQLKWKHQFQFAGYYAAKEKGFYKKAGLEVEILEPSDGQAPHKRVIRGEADFGVAMSDLLLLRNEGHEVVALAAIYQHSPLVLLTPQTSGIENIHQFAGKRLMLEAHSEELMAYFKNEGVGYRSMILYPHTYDTTQLINGFIDAMSAYSTDEPYMLLSQDIPFREFSPRSGGIDFYGDTLFTTQSQIDEHPERVKAFVDASLAGWRYAMKHPDEIIGLILEKYSQRHSREHLEFEAKETAKLIMPGVVEVGYMNQGRWRHIADTYHKLGMMPESFSLDQFLYDRNPAEDLTWLYLILAGAGILTTIAFLLTNRMRTLNRAMKKQIQTREQTEAQLRESERILSTLFSNLPGMVYRCANDEHWTMELVSQGSQELCGYPPEDLVGNRTVSWTQLIHPLDRDMVMEKVQNALKEFRPFTVRYRIEQQSGRVKWVWEQGRGVFTPEGDLRFLEGFITDIDDQTKARRELLVAKEEAEAASVAKSQFLANMSHEIRTPMNAVIGLAGLTLKTPLSGDQKKYVSDIQKAGRSLLSVINDLLDYSKVEAGKIELETRPFFLDDVLSEVASMVGLEAGKKGLELIFQVSPQTPHSFMGDPFRLRQVLVNLVGNAVKFTEKGEVALKVEVVEESRDPLVLQFCVRDTGMGMTPEQIENLFQPFTQAEGYTTRKYGGTGLGLSISRRLVEIMGGSMWVESRVNQGSEFRFTLPLGLSKNKVPPTLDNRWKSKRVLVVTGNSLLGEAMMEALGALSFIPEVAQSLDQAVQKGEEGAAPDLFLIDFSVDQRDAVKKFLWRVRPTPVVLMAGTMEEAPLRSMVQSMEGVVLAAKPLTRLNLAGALNRLVEPRQGLDIRDLEEDEAVEEEVRLLVQGAKVLLVEDNPMNQYLALVQLRRVGIDADVATNGLEALEAVERRSYDLVFMDIQMPEMDGLEAASLIRKNKQHRQLPIVAMTAHAMEQDREQSLLAGMNEHLAKPLEPDQLYRALKRWIVKGRKANGKNVPLARQVPALPGLDLDMGLARLKGRAETLWEMLFQFRDKFAWNLEHIERARRDKDITRLRKICHDISGVVAFIGAKRLFDASQQVRVSIQNDLPDEALEQSGELYLAFEELIHTLSTLNRNDGPEFLMSRANLQSQVEELLITTYHLARDHDELAHVPAGRLRDLLEQSSMAGETKALWAELKEGEYETAQARISNMAKALEVKLDDAEGA